jgi:hypothetical protein
VRENFKRVKNFKRRMNDGRFEDSSVNIKCWWESWLKNAA